MKVLYTIVMKIYVASRFEGADNKGEVEALCKAVREAKLVDFSFVRDVENYKQTFDDEQSLWSRVDDEITACNAILVDVSNRPSGDRLIEAGIAYAKHMPIIIVRRRNAAHSSVLDGIASAKIEYVDYKDLTSQLHAYESERNFSVNDRVTTLVAVVLVGVLFGAAVAQVYIPFGFLASVLYWLVVRWLFPTMRSFDRVVVYIPLAFMWLGVTYVLSPIYMPLAIAWLLGFWIVAIAILRNIKFSL